MIETLNTLDARVDSALQHNPYLFGKKLRFETSQGHVVLRGVVRTFFQKQMAQESIRKLEGVATIDNLLEVDN